MVKTLLVLLLSWGWLWGQDLPYETKFSRTCDAPQVMLQKGGSFITTRNAFVGWISFQDNVLDDTTKKILIGTLPDSCLISEVILYNVQGFNAGGTDILQVGYSGDHDAFINEPSMSDIGERTEVDGELIRTLIPQSRTIYAYYTGSGTAPTQGLCYIILYWLQIKRYLL